mgnify:CR=1 FL=1
MRVALLANLQKNAPTWPGMPADRWDDLDSEATIEGILAARQAPKELKNLGKHPESGADVKIGEVLGVIGDGTGTVAAPAKEEKAEAPAPVVAPPGQARVTIAFTEPTAMPATRTGSPDTSPAASSTTTARL